MTLGRVILAASAIWLGALAGLWPSWDLSRATVMYGAERLDHRALDAELASVLERAGFTGAIESTLERRLGRPINRKLANLGRLLWFDKLSFPSP